VSHNILSKVDRALAAYLVSVGAGTINDVYPAKRSDNKALPNTVCHSMKWRYAVPHSGVYVVSAQVMVKTLGAPELDQPALDVENQSTFRVADTFDAFFAGVDSSSEALAAAITAAARGTAAEDLQDFTIQTCEALGGDAGNDRNGPAWVDSIDLEIVCCPRDVS